MIEVLNKTINRRWVTCPRDTGPTRWAVAYVTLNRKGEIFLSGVTHRDLGSPDGYAILYDAERETIGLRPAANGEKNAYPAHPRGNYGGRRIHAYRMIREFDLVVLETVRFHRCMKDKHGILILDLRDTRPVSKKKKWRP